jgi:large subunit ribosomal protein L5
LTTKVDKSQDTLVLRRYTDEIIKVMSREYDYSNAMQIPDVEKIIIHRGLGESITNSKCIDIAMTQFAQLSSQTPVLTLAKKSISNFKLREGQINGIKVTLRGKKAKLFLIKFVNLVLPKIRDFRGVSPRSFDGRGNYTMGIKDVSIFPEVTKDTDKDRGLDLTIVTTAETNDQCKRLLEVYGIPFRGSDRYKLGQ